MSEKPMTGKDVLKRIAPIAITLVLIVLIAIVATSVKGCSNKTPTIDKSEDVYLEMGELKITNDRLYTYLKQEYGLAELSRLVDNVLYEKEMANVNKEALDEFIVESVFGEDGLTDKDSDIKKEENKEKWEDVISSLEMNNLISAEDAKNTDPYDKTSKAWETVRTYYKLQYARREWAKKTYVEKLREERTAAGEETLFTEEEMTKYFEANYSETATAIIIPFTSEQAAYKAMNAAGINTTTKMLDKTVAKKGWVSKDFNYNESVEVDKYLTSLQVYDAFIKMYNDVYSTNQITSAHYTIANDADKSLANAVEKLTAAISDVQEEVTGNIVLPTTIAIKDYGKDATVTWTVEEGATALVLEGNKLVYSSPEESKEIKVTATVTLEENQKVSKTYVFEVFSSETPAADATVEVEEAEAFKKYTFDTEALTAAGINLLWDIKSLTEINATLAKNVIYISEDSSSSSTLKVDANSDFVSSYTMKPISCGNYYFLVLKAAKVTGPNQEEKASEIEAGLIEELFAENDNNIDRMIYERRHDAGLEIYDRYIEAVYDYQYTYFYETTLKETEYDKFENSKKKQTSIVAKFSVDGEEKTITADELFKSLAEKYAVSVSIDLINEYRVVTSKFNTVYNPYSGLGEDTDVFKEILENEVGNFRKNFESDYFTYSYLSYYGFIPNFPADYGWKNFQKDYFGAYSDEELLVNANFGGSVYSEALTKLTESLYTDVEYSATDDENKASQVYKEMEETFNEWYGLNVVNLIVGIDTNYDGNFEQQSEKDEDTNEFTKTDWTAEQKDLAEKLMADIQKYLPQTNKSTTYAQLEEIVKVYNNASYELEAQPATADDTIYTYNYFAEYKRAGLVLKLESSQAYDATSSLVEEFLDALKAIYTEAKADEASDTFEVPYTATCETVYGFHLIYALSFKAKTELPSLEDIKLYNLVQEASKYANATLDYQVELYEDAVKKLKDDYDIEYTSEYAIDSEIESKISAWYTPAVTEVGGNTVLSEDLINYLDANKANIKVTSTILPQETYNRLLDVIIRVSKEDLAEK